MWEAKTFYSVDKLSTHVELRTESFENCALLFNGSKTQTNIRFKTIQEGAGIDCDCGPAGDD